LSLLGLFDIGKSALFASQAALTTTSNNIANVNTPGFSKQDVILDVANSTSFGNTLVGGGVTVSGIKRSYDAFIQSQLIGQNQNQGRSSALSQLLSQVEQVFGDSTDTGLSKSFTDFFNAWNDVATNPESQPQRTVLLQKAASFVDVAKQMESSITAAYNQTNNDIKGAVDQINILATDIAALNGKITQIEAGGTSGQANDLRDQRDNLLNQLASLTEFSYYGDQNGSLTITVGMRNLVEGDKTNALSTQTNSDGNQDLILDNTDITSNVTRGQLGGLLAAQSEVESGPLMGLRKMVASVTKEVNLLHSSGYGLDGTTGNDFFNPLQLSTKSQSAGAQITSASITDSSQLTLDEYTITFDASQNYSVTDSQTGKVVATGAYTSGNPISFDGIQVTIADGTGSVAGGDSFSVSPLTDAIKNLGVAITDPDKIAASSSDTELPGNNSNALKLAQLSNTAVANLGGSTFADFYGGIVSNVGTLSGAASDTLTFDQNMLSQLNNQRDSESGVSLDEEAVNLIRFQRSYEAAAKMIAVTDQLIQTVLGMVTTSTG
jgi:flagellar hook-associated protein 1 FlgK